MATDHEREEFYNTEPTQIQMQARWQLHRITSLPCHLQFFLTRQKQTNLIKNVYVTGSRCWTPAAYKAMCWTQCPHAWLFELNREIAATSKPGWELADLCMLIFLQPAWGSRPRSPLGSRTGRSTSKLQVTENCLLCKATGNKACCDDLP